MDDKHRTLLQKNRQYLVKNMSNIDEICDILIEEGAIELGVKQEIMKKKPAPFQQIRHLLDLATRWGPTAFDVLIKSFQESGNKHLVDKLIGKQEPKEVPKPEPKPEPEPEKVWPEETNIIVSVEPCKKDDPNMDLQGNTVYNMKKGKMLMFKNYGTTDTENLRNNIDRDGTNISQVFMLANFTTKTCVNKTKEAVIKELNKHTEEKEFKDYECLCVFLLSVGDNPQNFYGTLQNKLNLEEIKKLLLERPALKSKPKLVIMQSCCQADWNEACKPSGDQVDSVMESPVNDDDLFIVCSTPEKGVKPWINVGDMVGSWFLQAFAHVFKNHAHELPFLEILKKIDDCLKNARYMETDKENKMKEIKRRVASVNIVTKCERKQLYFFPGIPGQAAPASSTPPKHENQPKQVSSPTGDKDITLNTNKGDSTGHTCSEGNGKNGQSNAAKKDEKSGQACSEGDGKSGQACSEGDEKSGQACSE